MKSKKAVDSDLSLWKCESAWLKKDEWLTELFNIIFRTEMRPNKWRTSTIIPLYKNKGDIQDCNNYRSIKLLSHTMELWKQIG